MSGRQMSSGPYRLLPPHVDGGRRCLGFCKRSVRTSQTIKRCRLTESPLSAPVIQVGNVGEHVIDPVIGQSRTRCMEWRPLTSSCMAGTELCSTVSGKGTSCSSASPS